MTYYAHTNDSTDRTSWQTLEDHLQAVGREASKFADQFGAGTTAYLAGLWHDLGKYAEEFQRYIGNVGDEDGIHAELKGRVDHSTRGAQHAVAELKPLGAPALGYAIAYAIAGHHAGLPCGKATDSGSLWKRLGKEGLEASGVPATISSAAQHLRIPLPAVRPQLATFDVMFLIRMIFSALVDADYLDTEAFLDPEAANARAAPRPTYSELSDRLEAYMQTLEQPNRHEANAECADSIVHGARHRIRLDCLERAANQPGFFTLTVPTGLGKTLASLNFALQHATTSRMQRVIYAVPFTSIIEQTAQVFRDALEGDRTEPIVLEHHSNFNPSDADRWARLAVENWDAPVVVTTNVQLLESLYAHKPRRCRKLHNVARSVIILDEAQLLPPRQVRPILEVLKLLVANYGCTVVLCTATQPAFHRRPGFEHGIEGARELAPHAAPLFTDLRRAAASYIGRRSSSEIAESLSSHDQVLCIVNTTRLAAELHAETAARCDDNQCFHLSARMCAKHRSEVLQQIRDQLQDGKPCRVVSTQVIEAGVDIDFPVVFREMTGVDSIAQAAGRCNREGRLSRVGQVYVFEAHRAIPPGMLRQAAQTTDRIRPQHEDLLGLDAVGAYFRELLLGRDLDAEGAFRLSSESHRASEMDFDFPEVARRFRLISEETTTLIVPYDDKAHRLIDVLIHSRSGARALRDLQPYTVQVRPYQMRLLENNGRVWWIRDAYPVLAAGPATYDLATGLIVPDTEGYAAQELMV